MHNEQPLQADLVPGSHALVLDKNNAVAVRHGAAVVALVPVDLSSVLAHQTARRFAACVNACAGLTTEQLEAMVRSSGPGVLAQAYDVCSGLWEEFGVDLVAVDHPDFDENDINGGDAVDVLCQLASTIENVVLWAREKGAL